MHDPIMEFTGPYASLFVDYVRYKRTLGYSIPKSYQSVLRDISRMLAGLPQSASVVDKQAAELIATRKDGESIPNQCKRIAIIRQFCVFLRSEGYNAYILPHNLVRDESNFIPRIISEQEMARAIKFADETMQDWVGLLMRLLWCLGLRMGEALKLDVSDVDLEAATILVKRAKGDRTRLCPMSRSLSWHVASYMEAHDLGCVDGSLPLIPSADGNSHRSHTTAAFKIKSAFAAAKITRPEGTTARPHDIRHSFAIHSLEKAIASGMDAFAALPLLASFMGHADIKSTEYYLRLTEERFQGMVDAQAQCSAIVFGDIS
ncbi:tyrosine-type recombinase/integrase [Adlercreutzia sp. ZJ141]|uniref:tyrosine-type recombinase/integrase n=1 Tax=Adlercreutzia sp. ZJ141 TaxID=2709406 RepID=UPI0013EB7A9C|nr:tyrosine-type recombinase/integrase [Adlercreutzia sp. ZJ141]